MGHIRFAFVLAAALGLSPVAVGAQDTQTLADIRQELSVLYVEIQKLKRELSTTANPGLAVGGATALERMDRIEEELRRLTSKTESLELRVSRIVVDGTNRIGDLEFRLCELESDCDLGSLGDTPRLGGGAAPDSPVAAAPDPAPVTLPTLPGPTTPVSPGTETGGSEMAMGEQRDFDTAMQALQGGDYSRAAELFQSFVTTYPGGPLNAEAHYLRGEALSALGKTAEAGRAYLDSFSGSPSGKRAPDALLKLGLTLAELGQTNEACVMLGQVSARFPESSAAPTAAQQLATLTCS